MSRQRDSVCDMPLALALLALFAPPASAAPAEPPADPSVATDAGPEPDVGAEPELPPAEPAAEPATEPAAPPTRDVPDPVVVPEKTETAPSTGAEKPKKTDPVDVDKFRFVPGKGFELATKDGRFTLQIRARVQVRYDLEIPHADGENIEQILQIRRARLQFQGNVFGKHNKYYIQLGFSPRDMTGGLTVEDGSIRRNPLRDARLEFDYLRDFTIQVGQMKVPFSRQRVISSGNLNMVDRSIVNEEFNLDRDVGIQARSQDLGGLGNRLAYNVGLFMGEGRNAFELAEPGMLYVARVEVLPFGKFEDYSEGDLERSKKPGLSIGGAYAFHDEAIGNRSVHGDRFADEGKTDYHHATADILFKWYGASLLTAFNWRKGVAREQGEAVDEMGNPIPLEDPRSGIGWFAQLGYLVPKIELEVVGRYGLIRNPFEDRSSLGWRDEVGGGINYYFVGHNLKLQFDYFRLWDEELGPGFVTALRNGTDRIRLQLQFAF